MCPSRSHVSHRWCTECLPLALSLPPPPRMPLPALHARCGSLPTPAQCLRIFGVRLVSRALPGPHRSAIKDSWGFTKDKRAGADTVTGLIRIDAAKVVPLLSCSGYFGVYLEPVAHHPAYPQAVVDWHKPEKDEDWEALRLRLIGRKPPYGLVLGNRQLGLRKPPGPSHTPRSLWQVTATPVTWSDDFLKDVISTQTPATNVDVMRRQVRGKRCTWWLRATVPGDSDAHSLGWLATRPANVPVLRVPSLTRSAGRVMANSRHAGKGAPLNATCGRGSQSEAGHQQRQAQACTHRASQQVSRAPAHQAWAAPLSQQSA